MESVELQKLATATYRRQACKLLSDMVGTEATEKATLIKDMEQSLGQRCLLEDESIIDSLPDELPAVAIMKSDLDMRVPPSLVHCLGCGAWLQPGQNGTTVRLRSLGRGRTRRRRASRKKAKEYLRKKQASAAGGRQWKKDDSLSEQANSKRNNELNCVTDGTCKNAIVYTCGSCGTKRKFKGLAAASKRPNKTPSKQPQQSAQSDTKQQSHNQQKALREKSKSPLPSDFIPIAPAAEKGTTAKRRLDEPRKKKKKAPEKKGGSKLLDFLSSLNDP